MGNFVEAGYPFIDFKGQKGEIHIKISKPQKDPKSPHGDYFCRYEIKAPNLDKRSKAFGVDGLQSLWITLKLMQAEIKKYETEKNVRCEYLFDALWN
jgi:hypothetical protein